MSPPAPRRLLEDLYLFEDTCNVYLVRRGQRSVAVDFGSGAWMRSLPQLGVRRVDHVMLTHHHADQCSGLLDAPRAGMAVHAPTGEEAFLSPQGVRQYWRLRRGQGWPTSYSVLDRGLRGARFDMAEAVDLFWQDLRIRFLPTPGHGPNAHSVILNLGGRQVVFCGDAAHADATVWQPYHLEWSHWRWDGALAAWSGVNRLAQVGMDLLCPSHGPVVDAAPAAMLRRLSRKLERFYRSKLAIAPAEKDEMLPVEPAGGRAVRLSPHLYNFLNVYVLLSDSGEALVVDPNLGQLAATEDLLRRLGRPRVTALLCSHFHLDHTDGVPHFQRRHGARAMLHPWVALPIREAGRHDVPYPPSMDVVPDALLPERGAWRWNEYEFRVAPFPGQTWWHAAYQARIDGAEVFFGGDNFQPASRWNGTGGYSAYNGSRFREGFVRSAWLVLDWSPDVLCNGHQCFFRFRPSRFRKIIRWALATEKAVKDLCPTGDLEKDYYLHPAGVPRPTPAAARRRSGR